VQPPPVTEAAKPAPHYPVLAMPTGPRVAVLPFVNMSGNPKEEYFADGLTEDVITELSRFKDIYVLAPLSFLIAIHGQWERGVKLATKARELNMRSAAGWAIPALFYDYHRRGMYAEAVDVLKQHPNPGIVENLQKYTAAYPDLGEMGRAREYWEKCKQVDPEWSADKLNRLGDLWSFDKAVWTRYMQSIEKAGYRVSG
jgi:tetratricopeptide (TPR) repeat protein